jgi:DNA-binding GntR family transcriptional regulator
VEPMVAARATAHATPALVQAMEEDHRQMCEAVENADALRYLALNRGFHFRLYASAQTVMLLPLIESLWAQVGPHLHHVFRLQGPAPVTPGHHHVAILRALRRQDAVATSAAVWEDIADAADAILTGDSFAD